MGEIFETDREDDDLADPSENLSAESEPETISGPRRQVQSTDEYLDVAPVQLTSDGPQQPERTNVSINQHAREQLRRAGIDPGNVTVPVTVFEPTEWSSSGGPDSWHANIVARMMNDREHGLSPGARVRVEHVQKPFQSGRFNVNDYQNRDLRDFAGDIVADCFEQYTQHIQNARRNGDRVVTISSGVSDLGGIYQECLDEAVTQVVLNPQSRAADVRRILGEDRANQYFEFRAQQNQALERRVREFCRQNEPAGPNVTNEQRAEFERRRLAFIRDERDKSEGQTSDAIKQMVGTLRQRLSDELGIVSSRNRTDSPDGTGVVPEAQLRRIREAVQRWENTTRDAAENGMMIVVAAGNSGRHSYNILARSPHVISVGAADIGNSATEPRAGHVSPFSSTGNAYAGLPFERPTLLAQGTNVPLNFTASVFGTQRQQRSVDGTSVAAPIVGQTIGLMLTQNPNLTFTQVRDMLTQTARPLPVAPAIDRAIGMLVPDTALGALVRENALLSANAPTSAQGAGLLDIVGAVQASGNSRRR